MRAAASGFQALQSGSQFDPDAIVLDIMMPDLDSMAVLQRPHSATMCRSSS